MTRSSSSTTSRPGGEEWAPARCRSSAPTSRTARPSAAVIGRPARRHLPRRGPDRRAPLGRRPGARCARQRDRHDRGARGGAPPGAPGRVLLHRRGDLRRHGRRAHARGRAAPAAGALRAEQGRGGGLLRAVPPAARRPRGDASATRTCTGRARTRWARAASWRSICEHARPGRRRRCSARASRPATSSTSATWWRRTSWRRRATPPVLSTSAAVRRPPCSTWPPRWGSRPRWRRRGPARSSAAASTRRGRAASSAGSPRCGLADGIAATLAWVRAR